MLGCALLLYRLSCLWSFVIISPTPYCLTTLSLEHRCFSPASVMIEALSREDLWQRFTGQTAIKRIGLIVRKTKVS